MTSKLLASLLSAFLIVCPSLFAQTTVFSYTGSLQSYTVPAGVTTLDLKLWGAGGNDFGGGGAFVSGSLAVTPGEVLSILVGGGGGTGLNFGGGFGGGGNGALNLGNGGGSGGGRSAIILGSTELVDAGSGGGGFGSSHLGGGGGLLVGGSGVGGPTGGTRIGRRQRRGLLLARRKRAVQSGRSDRRGWWRRLLRGA